MKGRGENPENKLIAENLRLKTAVSELSIINDIATAISSTQPVNQIIETIVRKCIKHLHVEQGAVWLLDEKDLENPLHTMIRQQESTINSIPFKLDNQLTGWMLINKQPLVVDNLSEDKRFTIGNPGSSGINTLLSVPMILKGRMIGLVTVFNKREDSSFNETDQRLLSIIASQSAQLIENARLYEEEKALLAYKEEMRMARNIQLNLLPKSNPQPAGYDIFGISIPAKEVGGDYYDFIEISEGKLIFCLGDITGKGMPAAMLMSNLQATLRGQLIGSPDLTACVSNANKLLYASTETDKFATLFIGELDQVTSAITYLNAGHERPILVSESGTVQRLDQGGVFLGAFPDMPYEAGNLKLTDGDTLLIFSDGVTEAMNREEIEFGEKRLLDTLLSCAAENSKTITDRICAEIKRHAQNAPQSDDITLIAIKKI